ncbi:MAG TPA: hypothetical protein VND94_00800 [Terriglobia bacterium]|nr:hypothetical protein [Terriglobia bacterium]
MSSPVFIPSAPPANDNTGLDARLLQLSVCGGNAAIWAGLASLAGLSAFAPAFFVIGAGSFALWLGFIHAGRQ